MQIINLHPKELKPYRKNPRKHPQEQINLLVKNIKRFGFTTPILIDEKNEIKKQEDGGSTVWRFGREFNYSHPTQKPVQMIMKAIFNSSKEENLICGLFLGSGSTIIAAEKTGRICYGMELEPKYVDVIVKRWEDYTGQKAKLLG